MKRDKFQEWKHIEKKSQFRDIDRFLLIADKFSPVLGNRSWNMIRKDVTCHAFRSQVLIRRGAISSAGSRPSSD